MFQAQATYEQQFQHFVEQQQTAVYNLCYRLLGQSKAAEQVAQQTFVSVYDRFRQITTPDLLNLACDQCRRWLQKRPLYRPDPAPADSVQALLNVLSVEDRIVVALRYCCRLSCRDISDIVGSTAPDVRQHLYHARRRVADVVVQQAV